MRGGSEPYLALAAAPLIATLTAGSGPWPAAVRARACAEACRSAPARASILRPCRTAAGHRAA